MRSIQKYIGDLYLADRFYLALGLCIILFIVSFFIPAIYIAANLVLLLLTLLVLIDYLFLFVISKAPAAKRITADRFSNGDENKVELQLKNNMRFTVDMEIIDELPEQFQKRDWKLSYRFRASEQKNIIYNLRPVTRGEYTFGRIIMYVSSLLGLLKRRHNIEAGETIPVYPSFLQMRKYELLSQTTIQTEYGNKRMRKIGHSMEFEQI
ncbi:MAG: DUF58 domain-containing protein, partial [Ferruginibacter sp.]